MVFKKSMAFTLFFFRLNSGFKNWNLTLFKVYFLDKDIFNDFNTEKKTLKSVVDTDNIDEIHYFAEYQFRQKKC